MRRNLIDLHTVTTFNAQLCGKPRESLGHPVRAIITKDSLLNCPHVEVVPSSGAEFCFESAKRNTAPYRTPAICDHVALEMHRFRKNRALLDQKGTRCDHLERVSLWAYPADFRWTGNITQSFVVGLRGRGLDAPT